MNQPDPEMGERSMSQRSLKTKPRFQRLKLADKRQKASRRLEDERRPPKTK